MKRAGPALILVLALTVMGCAAAETWLKYKDLETQTQMSHSIFLEPVPPEKKTVWVEVKSTADEPLDLSVLSALLTQKGWRVVNDPHQANFRLQVNVLQVGKASLAAIRDSLYAGWGGTVAGTAIGGVIGTTTDSPKGIGIGTGVGGVIGAGVELVTGALVKKVTYSVITDVQLAARSDQPVAKQETTNIAQGSGSTVAQQVVSEGPWKLYRTRVASTATKANLSFEEARPALTERLLKSLAGIL